MRQRAFLEQILRLLAVARQDAVADEAVADPADHRDLAQALGEGEARGDDIVGRRIGPHDLEKLHHVGRAEEMQPHHVGRTRCGIGYQRNIKVTGIRCQDCSRLQDRIEIAEQRPLDLQILEHRLDDEIAIRQGLDADGVADQPQPLVPCRRRQPAARNLPVVGVRNARLSGGERLFARLDDFDVESRIGKGDGDAGTHGSGADDPDLLDRARLNRVEARKTRDLPFGEEGMPQGGRLLG